MPHYLLAIWVSLLLGALATAAPIPLINPSGEVNNGADRTAVSDPSVPGWDGVGQVINDRTDFGNGGWRLSIEDSGEIRQMTSYPIAAGDAYSLRFDASVFAGPTTSRILIADLYVDNGGSPQVIATRNYEFKSLTVPSWHHYHLAAPAGTLDAHVGKTVGVRFRSNDLGSSRFQSVDNVRLEVWPASAPDGSFADGWDSTPDQVWAGPGYWANRLHDWEVRSGRVNCILGGRDRRTLHRVGTSIRGNGGDFSLSVRTGLHAGTDGGNARSGFLIGAGSGLDWRGALLVHDGLGRDFGLFIGLRSDGTAVIEDYSTNATTQIAGGATPAGGFPAAARLDLTASYITASGEYTLDLKAYDGGNNLLSNAAVDVPSDRVLGSFGLLSHKGSNSARFWFDDFAGSGTALHPEPERHLAILGSMYTLSRGTLKLTAQLSPVDLGSTPPVTLETWDGAAWNQAATAPVDNTDGLSSYTATFTVPAWDDSKETPVRVGVTIGGETFRWTGTVRRDPVEKDEIVVAATTCQRISDGTIQNNGYDWSPVRLWQPHTLAFDHIAKQDPDLLLALGDQIYEGQPTPEDSGNDFNRQHDYLYKWYLWVLQARELTREMPTIAMPDDHDVFQGNLWGEGGIATASQNTGGYEEPASWVKLVDRTQTSHLPDPDPYHATQPPPPIAQGIGVYFTGMVYGRVGFAVLEDRKFKTGRDNPPADLNQQFLLGERQKDFLRAWNDDWGGQCIKAVVSQSPFGNLHTHANASYGFGLNDRDAHGWPLHRRNEVWQLLRQSRMFQIAGDQHLATVAHHGADVARDAGYSFTAPAIANFFPRCWDPVHNGAGRTNTISPYKGDFFFDGNGTLPSGEPNLNADFPAHVNILAAANPLEYHNLSTGINPANLHDRGAGYGIVRIDKSTREITFECWPLHADPEFPQTGSQFPDWPLTITQTDNDGRAPTGFLPVIDAGWRKDFVVRVSDEDSGELLYTMRVLGNRFRPPVYNNASTYRVEIAYGDGPLSETRTAQAPAVAGAPAINRFAALQPAITTGGTATLGWDVESPATLSIDQGIGDVLQITVNGIGQVEVSPAADTTYTLTLNGGIDAQTSVRVLPDQATWLDNHFTDPELLVPLVSGNDADPDLDGLDNWEEFLFQTNPRAFTPPVSSATVVEDSGQHFIEFDLPTPLVQMECSARIATSDNLETWALVAANSFTEVSREMDPSEGTPRIRLRLGTPIPEAAARKFYHAFWEL